LAPVASAAFRSAYGARQASCERFIKAAAASGETAPAHHAYATDIIEELTRDGFEPVAHAGSLWVVEDGSEIWVRKDYNLLATLVAKTHDGKKNCTRHNDYTGIAQHAMSLVSDASFFDAAPVGLACTDGFYRLVGNAATVVNLTNGVGATYLAPAEILAPRIIRVGFSVDFNVTQRASSNIWMHAMPINRQRWI